jgi:membrane-bound lytic murein transglycosylase B
LPEAYRNFPKDHLAAWIRNCFSRSSSLSFRRAISRWSAKIQRTPGKRSDANGPLSALRAVLLAGLAATGAAAEETPPPIDETAFAQCLITFRTAAIDAGVSESTTNRVLSQVSLSERVLELDRRQPEFTQTFADYFNRRVTAARVDRGRELLASHRALLSDIQRRTGVPPQYLVAFWGLETNFGSYLGKMAIPDSLATLACDRRRSRYFTGELVSALRIIDSGDVALADMNGSWAGAMGHVQFMPSAYLRYAVDFDGDGRRDLFSSTEDALASAGNFLKALGWQPGLRWGREVQLPETFDYTLTRGAVKQPLGEWRRLGVTDAFGHPLSTVPVEAALRLPAGHRGPAFLTYANFDVIMGWNRSVYYALAVGHLADRIAGAGRLQTPPPEDDLRFSNDELMDLQRQLVVLGYDPGEPDGRLGPATRTAVSLFQSDNGFVPDGHLDPSVVEKIRDLAAAAPG